MEATSELEAWTNYYGNSDELCHIDYLCNRALAFKDLGESLYDDYDREEQRLAQRKKPRKLKKNYKWGFNHTPLIRFRYPSYYYGS
mmetsp:Transcript_28786/g.73685  ORF Transcript_28786/g.73685 Transcript_28786/m.73685 type:complete len:86 (+) Transcript_28786:6401-6658(+)